jgi:hypothetical protein
MFDNTGRLLTPAEIMRLARTESGRRKVADYIWQARTAAAAQGVMEALGVIPTPEIQQKVCDIIWGTLFRVSIFDIMDYAKSVAEAAETSDMDVIGRA